MIVCVEVPLSPPWGHFEHGGNQKMADLEPTAWATAGGLAVAGILKLLDKFGWRRMDQADAIRAELRADVERLTRRIDDLYAQHRKDIATVQAKCDADVAAIKQDVEYWRDLYYDEHDKYLRLAAATGSPR